MPRRADRKTRWLRGLVALLVLPLLGLAAVAAAQTAAPRPPAIYYAHTDHLGTPHALTDETGAVVWQAEYTPFGTATVSSDGVVLNLRFPGEYYDQETGLHYNYFRDYDPTTGRYIESDPIGLEGGLNTYAYVGGNPISNADPTGLLCGTGACVATAWAIGIGVGTVSTWWAAQNAGDIDWPDNPPADPPRQCEDDEPKCWFEWEVYYGGPTKTCVYKQRGSFGLITFPQ